jgi:hypothetical protein
LIASQSSENMFGASDNWIPSGNANTSASRAGRRCGGIEFRLESNDDVLRRPVASASVRTFNVD